MDANLNAQTRTARELSWKCVCALSLLLVSSGCYAPLRSPGIPACTLPDTYRIPRRTNLSATNLARLTAQTSPVYTLGPNDILEVTVEQLYPAEQGDSRRLPIQVQVTENGTVYLPLVGAVRVQGMSLGEANQAITEAYRRFIANPLVSTLLVEKGTVNVLVFGEVKNPGSYSLPRNESDVAHALAAAGGLLPTAEDELEVHRRARSRQLPQIQPEMVLPDRTSSASGWRPRKRSSNGLEPTNQPAQLVTPNRTTQPDRNIVQAGYQESQQDYNVVQVPLRGYTPPAFRNDDVVLGESDVVVVPKRKDAVFYVVGPLSPNNVVRLVLRETERHLGNAFLLPEDRDIDVVTAVVMAGYIDPIESPTTVTVQRTAPDGQPMLILVDLIKARFSWSENLYVEPGDIIYLNPDPWWWSRRTFDRIIANVLEQYINIKARREVISAR